MKAVHSEYHGRITIRGLDRYVVIAYKYDLSGYIEVGDCYTSAGKKSALLKKRLELDLPIFLEAEARKDFERRMDLCRDMRAEQIA